MNKPQVNVDKHSSDNLSNSLPSIIRPTHFNKLILLSLTQSISFSSNTSYTVGLIWAYVASMIL